MKKFYTTHKNKTMHKNKNITIDTSDTLKNGFLKSLKQTWMLYLMIVPGLIILILFKWLPLFGTVIAFEDYSPFLGILNSPWVGLRHFKTFLTDAYWWILLKNTVLLAAITLAFTFPAPIIFAIFLNELKGRRIKKFVQSTSIFPYFISGAVMISIIYSLLSPQGGLVNRILSHLGLNQIFFMAEPSWFRPIYVLLNIWQGMGYNAIIYLAAITGIDPELYDAAEIDGANRWQRIFKITLPSISNVIIILFITRVGSLFTVDTEKVLLMYNPSVYEVADVIPTYVYRQAFASGGFPRYSYATAVSLFQSFLAVMMVIFTNKMAKKYSDTRLF